MKYNSVSTVQYWQQTKFHILVNLSKWYVQIFLMKMVVVLITLTQKINDCRLWSRYWRSEWQTIHSTLPFPLYSGYYHYFHSLLRTLQSTFIKVKKENLMLGSNADHAGTVSQSYQYANRLVVSKNYWYLWISHW